MGGVLMAKRRARSNKSFMTRIPSQSNVCKYCGMNPCCCHSRGLGWVFLLLGVLYLIRDLGGFSWWVVNWWTALLIICGLWMIRK